MPSKQQEFYNRIRQQVEADVQTYQEFEKQIAQIKKDAATRIKSLQADMKVIAKQIKINNATLRERGQEEVKLP